MTRRMVKDIFAGTVPEHGAQDIAGESVGSKQRVQSPAVRALGLQMEQITPRTRIRTRSYVSSLLAAKRWSI